MDSWRQALGYGVLLLLIGLPILAGAAVSDDSPGRTGAFLGACLVTGVGGLLVQVGVIAWGVEIGTRNLWERNPASPTTAPTSRAGDGSLSPLFTWLAGGVCLVAVVVLIAVAVLTL